MTTTARWLSLVALFTAPVVAQVTADERDDAFALRMAFYGVLFRERALDAHRDAAVRLERVVDILERRELEGEASGYELKLVRTNLSGPSLVNEVPTVIPSIVNFIKNNVEVGDGNNEWVMRE